MLLFLESRTDVIKLHLMEMIQSCYEVMKAGSRFYQRNNINAAEHIWQASITVMLLLKFKNQFFKFILIIPIVYLESLPEITEFQRSRRMQ
jgi:hypothetical protein